MVNPDDIGFDVILLIGQSNMTGHSTTTSFVAELDFTDPRIRQRPANGTFAGRFILAADPLWHNDRQATGAIGLGMTFAKRYVQSIPPNRQVLLVPQASGGTGFSDNRWNPGNDLALAAVNAVNSVLAQSTKHRLVAILWHQGEKDVAMSKQDYATRLDAMINWMRSQITGAIDCPFVLGEMARSWVAQNISRTGIQSVINETPQRLYFTRTASSVDLTVEADGIHFNGPSLRILGERYFDAFTQARLNKKASPSNPSNVAIASVGSKTATVTWQASPGATQSYKIRYRSGREWTQINAPSSPATLLGLLPDTRYELQVSATNNFGDSEFISLGTKRFLTNSAIGLPSPIWHYRLNGNFTDSSPNNFTATPTSVSFVSSDRGTVATFGQEASQIRVNSGIRATYTKMAWVRFTMSAVALNQNVISSNVVPEHVFWIPDQSRLALGYTGDFIALSAPPNNEIPENIWTHVACTVSGAIGRLFVNGVMVAERTNLAAFAGIDAPAAVFIGNYSANVGWRGQMYDVRLYANALSQQQIAQAMAE